jgi:hypothetical protein
MANDAMSFAPNGLHVYIEAEDAASGALLGSFFVPQGAPPGDRVRPPLGGKMLVRMRLNACCGGATAGFGISASGAWELPCGTLLGMVNPL